MLNGIKCVYRSNRSYARTSVSRAARSE